MEMELGDLAVGDRFYFKGGLGSFGFSISESVIWEVAEDKRQIRGCKVIDPGDSSRQIGIVYRWLCEHEVVLVATPVETTPISSSNSLYCSCTSPSLITNNALGKDFQVCQVCKKERQEKECQIPQDKKRPSIFTF